MKYRIRFNKNYIDTDHLYWRVIDDLGHMELVTNVIINVPSATNSSYEYDHDKDLFETKWNIECEGKLTIVNSVATIESLSDC